MSDFDVRPRLRPLVLGNSAEVSWTVAVHKTSQNPDAIECLSLTGNRPSTLCVMEGANRETRWVRITAEATVEIIIDARPSQSANDRLSPGELASVGSLLDLSKIVDKPDSGARFVHSDIVDVDEVDEDGLLLGETLDFVSLFPLCRCGLEDKCDKCGAFQLTPRTALALRHVAYLLADFAYDDVEQHGDDPVEDRNQWALFDEYPPITAHQDAVWRRQAARAFDDLAADVEHGVWPQPRCPAEEMALYLTINYAEDLAADEDGPIARSFGGLPEHPDDLDWVMARECLLYDLDIEWLYDREVDGIEDPESDLNKRYGMGDYRPVSWFKVFGSAAQRDGRRPFRR